MKALPWTVSELVPSEIEAADGKERVAIACDAEHAQIIVQAVNRHEKLLSLVKEVSELSLLRTFEHEHELQLINKARNIMLWPDAKEDQ